MAKIKCELCGIELVWDDEDIVWKHKDSECNLDDLVAGSYTWECINKAIITAKEIGRQEIRDNNLKELLEEFGYENPNVEEFRKMMKENKLKSGE
jgi:hypothetical protein